VTMTASPSAAEQLQIAECDAWFEYLAVTHELEDPRYREVEPWAWAKLQQRLRAIDARRARVA
jgi:hypothetical protein